MSVGMLMVLGTGVAPVAAQAPPSLPDPRGQAAIDRLGYRLPAVAKEYGMSAAQLHVAFLQDDTLSVDTGGKLFYVDESDGSAAADPAPNEPAAAPPTTDPVFSLHSRPGADHTIYLDFDGHTTVGTTWNSAYGVATIESPPYDVDGDSSTWNATELARIADTFAIVAEDFAPFDVDVTTEAPPVDRLINSGGSDTRWGVRVVITDDTFASCGCGGHAYINSFNWNTDIPVFVYNSSLVGVAEASSHEVGHSVGLAHDGTNSATYYTGHGSGEESWAPIMGAGYYETVTQWSLNEYTNSNNNNSSANYGKGPDDLAIITTYNGFGYRADDHGDDSAGATVLSVAGADGVIERTSDVDVFRFTTGGGPVTLTVDPEPLRPNLNVALTLRDSGGTTVATSSPTSGLGASIATTLADGTYFLEVDGVGAGSPLASPPTGYTEYGSLGQYTVSASFSTCVPDGLVPGVPTGLTATPNSGGWIDLAWSEGVGDEASAGYYVYRDGGLIATVGGTSYQDASISNNVVYSYTVVAFDNCAETSASSDPATASLQGVDRASAEIFGTGTVGGSYTATHGQDDAYESLTETHSGGRKNSRHDEAAHVWRFDLTGGNDVFNIDAYVIDGGDGDNGFDLEWSTSSTGGWQPLFTVSKGSDDDALQSQQISGASGTIYVRAVDTDQTGDGNYAYDTLLVDEMFFDGGAPPTGPPGQASSPDPADGAIGVATDADLTWGSADDADGYLVCFETTAPTGSDSCTNPASGTSFDPGTLAALTTYYWRVDAVNALGTTKGAVWSFTTQDEASTASAALAEGTASGTRGEKYGTATVTITDDFGNPVSGASVTVQFSGDFSDSLTGVTDAGGVVVLTTATSIRKPSFSACVSLVDAPGLTWDGVGC